MLHIVNVAEVGFPQVRSQCRKDRMRHRRLINLRSLAHQKLDQWRQSSRHLGWLIGIGFLRLGFQSFLTNGQCALHDTWHGFRLIAVAGALDASQPFVLGLSVGGEDLGYPCGIIVADVS